MSRLSIRARLVCGMVLLVSVGLAVANVAGVLLMRSYLLERVDNQVSAFAPGQAPPAAASRDLCDNPGDPRGLRTDFVLLVLDSAGQEACSLGPDLGQGAPDLTQTQLAGQTSVATVTSLDGQTRWRVRAATPSAGDQTIVFAVSLAEADATVARLTRLSLVVSLLVLVGTAAAAWVIARLGMRPLEKVEDTFEQIADGDLTQRVPDHPPRTEVGRLSRALNGMLGQIEQAFNARAESEARLRRFISDASHELRTPIAAVRGHAEMWRNGVTDDLDTVMGRIEAESTRMGDLVDDMLLLARLDQARPLDRAPVDLLSLATDALIDARALQPDRPITLVAAPGSDPAVVIGDEARLRQILANLVTNALTHTPTDASVEIRLDTTSDQVSLSVTDTGPGIAPEVVDKIFDRFYRADAGRTRAHGGSGLGLAIVRSLTEAHHGQVTCTSEPGVRTTFAVTLPLRPGPQGPTPAHTATELRAEPQAADRLP